MVKSHYTQWGAMTILKEIDNTTQQKERRT